MSRLVDLYNNCYKRNYIILQGYTPHRPNSARQGVAEKRVVPIKGDKRPDHSDLAGAGAELAAVLKRQVV